MPVSKHITYKSYSFYFTNQTYEILLLFQLLAKMNVDLVVIVQIRVFVFVNQVSPERDVKNVQLDFLGQIVKNANARVLTKMFVMTDWKELENVDVIKDLLVKIVIRVLL